MKYFGVFYEFVGILCLFEWARYFNGSTYDAANTCLSRN